LTLSICVKFPDSASLTFPLARFPPLQDTIGELLTYDGAERGIHDAVMHALINLKKVHNNPQLKWRSGMMMHLEELSPAEIDILRSLRESANCFWQLQSRYLR